MTYAPSQIIGHPLNNAQEHSVITPSISQQQITPCHRTGITSSARLDQRGAVVLCLELRRKIFPHPPQNPLSSRGVKPLAARAPLLAAR